MFGNKNFLTQIFLQTNGTFFRHVFVDLPPNNELQTIIKELSYICKASHIHIPFFDLVACLPVCRPAAPTSTVGINPRLSDLKGLGTSKLDWRYFEHNKVDRNELQVRKNLHKGTGTKITYFFL